MNLLKMLGVQDEVDALPALLESCKEKLIEAGVEVVKAAGTEAEGLTIDAHLTLTVRRKP